MTLKILTWNSMKATQLLHNLKMNYDIRGDHYVIYCIKGVNSWKYTMPKRDADKSEEQTEFETYFMPFCGDQAA